MISIFIVLIFTFVFSSNFYFFDIAVLAESTPYSLTDVKCSMNGQESNAVFYSGDFSAALTLKDGDTTPPLLIAAQYCDDILIQCDVATLQMDSNRLIANMNIRENDVENTGIKLFLWDHNLKPMTDKPGKLIHESAVYLRDTFQLGKNSAVSQIAKAGDTFTEEDGYIRLEQSGTATSSSFLQYTFTKAIPQTLVLEADVRCGSYLDDADFNEARLFMLSYQNTDGNRTDIRYATVKNGGFSGLNCYSLKKNIWTNVCMMLDFESRMYTLYINHTEVKTDNLPSDISSMTFWRMEIVTSSSPGAMEVTNLCAYSSDTLLNFGNYYQFGNGVFSEIAGEADLNGCRALSPYSNTIFYNGEKQMTDTPCVMRGDEALVSVNTFEKLFGVTPVISGNQITVGDVQFTIGQKEMKISEQSVSIDTAPEIVESNLLLPAKAYGANVLKERFQDNLHGTFLVSTVAIDATADQTEADNYLFFNRYTGRELLKKMNDKWGSNLSSNDAHPRILATEETFARIKEMIAAQDPYITEWYKIVQSYVNNNTKLPGKSPFTDTYTYDDSEGKLAGINSAGEKVSVASMMTNCTLCCGMLYHLTDDATEKKKYADVCINLMKQFCSFQDWYPGHQLETGEMEFAIAIGYDWFYDALTDEDKAFIYEGAKRNGFTSNRAVYYGTADFDNSWWAKTNTNWGGVINGGVIALALATVEQDPDYNMDTLKKSLRSLEYSVHQVAPDGAWHEGPNYWAYYLDHLTYAMAAYESAIGETYEGVYHKGMKEICMFQNYFTMPNYYAASFNDAGYSKYESFGRLYLAGKYKNGDIEKSYIDTYDAVYKGYSSISRNYAALDMLWYDPNLMTESIDLPMDKSFRETEFMSMRESWSDPNSLFVMADGGNSSSSHSHLDTGSFQLMLNGILWAKDLGSENLYYSRTGQNYLKNAGLSEKLYYRRKAEGHNMVVINPEATKFEINTNVNAVMNGPYSNGDHFYAYLDLASTYGSTAVNAYKRGYLVSDNRRSLTVRDEISLVKQNSDLYWFMHYVTDGVVGNITTEGNTKCVTVTKDGQILKLIFYIEQNGQPLKDYTIEDVPAERMLDITGLTENQSSTVSIREKESSAEKNGNKLKVHLNTSGDVSITVKLFMQGESVSAINTANISNW